MKSGHLELGRIIAPAAVRRAGNDDYPILSMTMRDGLVNQADKFKKRIASADTSPYKVVERNQLVVGFPIDEGVLAFQNLHDEAIVSPAYNIWNLQNDASVDRKYLERFLRSPRALAFYASKLRNTTARRRSLPNDMFLSLSVPVPPLAEQERIVKLLDEVDELRRLRTQADHRTAALIPALFHEMFGDPITNSKGLPTAALGELASVERGKFTPRPRNDPSYFGGDFPFIQTGDIANSDGFVTRHSQTLNEKGKSVSKEFPAGAIVIAIVGATIGQTAILGIPVFATDSVVAIQPHRDRAIPEYIHHVLRFWRPVFVAQAPETARANLNVATLKAVETPVPPLALQKEFAARVTEIRAVQTEQAASRQRLENLFQSMLHKAFNGEL
jgi:type I restriction enzyme S subunit